ncbi:autotransporter outer membrane beta-barrel domain-containing protein [Komagataeibacter europaeus]|uniref:autotransporter outer membrane beta-barrel domain-containing protein n=1 Tax=Komagataeibacter europaeus TaxID=33995 RepID=UPI001EE27DB6|nr:autotransporter domain-containing protein [Komagataeibacter europaeus]
MPSVQSQPLHVPFDCPCHQDNHINFSIRTLGDSHDGVDFQEAPTGTVINQAGGLISGERHGITTDGYVDVYNAAGATIIGRNGSGVGSDGTGKVVNYGTIIGGYNGSGTGDGDGVDIDGYATVDNYGTIKAEGAAGVDKGGSLNISEALTLTGGGTIINEKDAVISSVQVGVTLCCTLSPFVAYNYGTIHGTDIGVSAMSTTTLYNYGSITGDYHAFETYVGPANITLYNYGTISSPQQDALFMGPDSKYDIYMYAGSKIHGNIESYGAVTFHNDADYTMANTLIGSGSLTKAGSGLLDYTGDGSGYSGQADVTAGTLAVDGNLASAPVTVESGAMLEGGGQVGSVVVDQGAVLQGGRNGTGTLSVNGDLQQQAGSALVANGGHVSVTGSATIAQGAQLVMSQGVLGGLRNAGTDGYRVLSAAQGVSGTYALQGDTQVSSFESIIDAYDANDVYLRTEQTRAFTDVAVTRNQRATAGALDALASSGIASAVGLVGSDAQARQALNATSGEIHASARTALIQDSFYLRNAAIDRLRGAACDPGAGPQSTANLHGRRTDGTCQQEHAALWGEAYGGWGHNSGDGNAAGMHHSVGGFILGADTPVFGTWRVGGLVSYGHSAFDVGGRDSSGHSNTVSVGGYAGTHWGRLALRIGATYSWDMLGMNRQVAFAGYSSRESSAYMGGTAQGFGDLGYRFNAGLVALEPFANVAYVNLHTDGFHEHGGNAALVGRAMDTGTTYSTFGLRMSSILRAGAVMLVPNASFAYRHAFGELTPTTREYFAQGGGTTFDIAGVPLSENAAVVDAGLKAVMSDRIDVGVSYIGQYGERSRDTGIRGKFRLKF